MTLGFSTELKGKPTYFVEKIWEAILQLGLEFKVSEMEIATKALSEIYIAKTYAPKLHTFRRDEKNRWKVGMIIDFFINVRTKQMFRFAPKLKVKGIQKVEIKWFDTFGKKLVRVFIEDKSFAWVIFDKQMIVTGKMLELAQNDGFDTIQDFFEYFLEDFTGKIIHWTDLKY